MISNELIELELRNELLQLTDSKKDLSLIHAGRVPEPLVSSKRIIPGSTDVWLGTEFVVNTLMSG